MHTNYSLNSKISYLEALEQGMQNMQRAIHSTITGYELFIRQQRKTSLKQRVALLKKTANHLQETNQKAKYKL